MKLKMRTSVKADLKSVKDGFTEDLFLALSPPFPKVRLLKFDGSRQGDIVSLELNFLFLKQKWTSRITEDQLSNNRWYFVDEGIELPFFLSSWRHHHEVKQYGKTVIGDYIQYSSGNWLADCLLYPALWLQFAYRIPIYKRFFSRP